MKNKTWEDRFENYWHGTFGTMSSEDYIKYKDVGKCQTKQGFQAGYQLAQKELEEQLKESREVIEYYASENNWKDDDIPNQFTTFDDGALAWGDNGGKRALAYLEKWK